MNTSAIHAPAITNNFHCTLVHKHYVGLGVSQSQKDIGHKEREREREEMKKKKARGQTSGVG